MGAEGGRATFQKHGRKHMQEIAARGFASLVARKFAGDKEAAVAWLHAHAAESLIDRLVSGKLDQQIEEGATCAVEELPIILWPDDDISGDEPKPFWRERVSPRSRGVRVR
jgi:hypothetical protein